VLHPVGTRNRPVKQNTHTYVGVIKIEKGKSFFVLQ
jgi:hypothetical protein